MLVDNLSLVKKFFSSSIHIFIKETIKHKRYSIGYNFIERNWSFIILSLDFAKFNGKLISLSIIFKNSEWIIFNPNYFLFIEYFNIYYSILNKIFIIKYFQRFIHLSFYFSFFNTKSIPYG